jgi:hypothetical protein
MCEVRETILSAIYSMKAEQEAAIELTANAHAVQATTHARRRDTVGIL